MEAKDHKNRMCQRKHQPRRIVLAGVCFHHTGYSDVHIEKMRTCVETWKTYYGHRGWFQRPTCSWRRIRKWPRWKARAGRIQQAWYWMKQWLMIPNCVALNTKFKTRTRNGRTVFVRVLDARCMRRQPKQAKLTCSRKEPTNLHEDMLNLRTGSQNKPCGSGTERKKTKKTRQLKRHNWVHPLQQQKQEEVREAEQQHKTTTAWQREEQVNRKKKKSSKLSTKIYIIWTKRWRPRRKTSARRSNKESETTKEQKDARLCREFSSSSKESKRTKIARQERDFLSRAWEMKSETSKHRGKVSQTHLQSFMKLCTQAGTMKEKDDKDTDGRLENQCDSVEERKNGNSEDEKTKKSPKIRIHQVKNEICRLQRNQSKRS